MLLNLVRNQNHKDGPAKGMQVSDSKTEPAQEEIILAETLDSIDTEISVNYLDDQLEFLKKQKAKILKRNQNKLRNQLDQLIMRGEARLRTLNSLNNEQLEMERLLVVQRQMKAKVESFKFFASIIDFEQFRDAERQLLEIDFKANSVPSETIPVDFENDLSQILKSLHIDEQDSVPIPFEEDHKHINLPVPIDERINDKERDVQNIIDHIRSQGVKCFYHVTHINNSESINNNGLFSWENLEKNKIRYFNELTKDSLSQELDRNKKKGNYVRLSFCNGSAMFHARRDLQINVIYRIDLEVLKDSIFQFSNMNGAHNQVKFGSSLDFLKKEVRIDITQRKYREFQVNSLERKLHQAEVLIYEHIPNRFIMDCQRF